MNESNLSLWRGHPKPPEPCFISRAPPTGWVQPSSTFGSPRIPLVTSGWSVKQWRKTQGKNFFFTRIFYWCCNNFKTCLCLKTIWFSFASLLYCEGLSLKPGNMRNKARHSTCTHSVLTCRYHKLWSDRIWILKCKCPKEETIFTS